MAFEHLGGLDGSPPVIRRMMVGADCYVGQLLQADDAGLGHVEPCTAASAGPDVTYKIVGICVGVYNNDPSYNSTYKGDMADYDSSQADQLANSPKGAVEVAVALIRPGDMIKAPICTTTYGTAPTVITATSTDAAGDDVVHASDTITAPVNYYATCYCRSGANRGLSRIITAGGTNDQDIDGVMFPYDIAIGDTFVCASMRLGYCLWDLISTSNAFESSHATNYYTGYCHEVNLEEAGKEFAVISVNSSHLAM